MVQLQTNFGGGKTHSMLALYHLFSGASAERAGRASTRCWPRRASKSLPKAKRVVLVGNKISPGNPVTKPDGTVVRTLWGELAWQLGGKKAFARIAKDDEKATNPGDVLRELFNEYGPCLILIDEWVAYARQLHDQSDLPAGSFETQFTFAQALTESAKLAKQLPARHLAAGVGHRRARRIRRPTTWRWAASAGARRSTGCATWSGAWNRRGGRRPPRKASRSCGGGCSSRSPGRTQFKQRDVTARAFADLYHAQAAEFPPECRGGDYEKRIQAAYPIHPEIFDRLYTDWSTLVKFQRTRGVLRLMAAVIHSLWEKGDRNPLILPSTIPIDDARVQSELTRYLSDNWAPIIEKDVDGPNSLPLRIDGEQPNLGKLHATRRVARTIYLGSAPTAGAAHRGLEDRRVKLGCVMPGESPAVFGDALRRLAGAATYLYQDGPRFWYATQPTVTKLAEDRAEQLKRDPDKVVRRAGRAAPRRSAQDRRLLAHPRLLRAARRTCPTTSMRGWSCCRRSTRTRRRHAARPRSAAKTHPRVARQHAAPLSATRWSSSRPTRCACRTSTRRCADTWRGSRSSPRRRRAQPRPAPARQAETQKQAADGQVLARIPETYQWLLVPEQANPQAPVTWQATRLSGSDALAVRASKKLRSDELLVTSLGSTILRKHLDDVPLWPEGRVAVGSSSRTSRATSTCRGSPDPKCWSAPSATAWRC